MYSFVFMIFTQINHLTNETMKFDKNYYIHQIINSHNIAPNSYVMYLISGGLNMQIEHHIIPSCNSCNLYKIQPHIEELCKRHKIPYLKSNNLFDAIKKYFLHLYDLRS